jgi:hypothetical protein
MNITELDEWQGLTAESISKWLVDNGWQQTKPNWWDKGEDGFLFDSHVFDQQWFWLHALAAIHETDIQGMLREINPRMRKGMPSRAALEAHGENGDWVVFRNVLHAVRFVWTVCDAVQMVSGFDVFRGDNPEDAAMIAECSFWPCDKHGNKVRWPTDADGKML